VGGVKLPKLPKFIACESTEVNVLFVFTVM
jgi:hypothetical protein